MEYSVEISMYPLNKDYKLSIISFIQNLRKHPFIKAETNGISTQVFEDYSRVMKAIKYEIENTFLSDEKVVFNLKSINTNLEEKPNF